MRKYMQEVLLFANLFFFYTDLVDIYMSILCFIAVFYVKQIRIWHFDFQFCLNNY